MRDSMNIFSSKKLDKLADRKFKNNKEFMNCLNNKGIIKSEDAIKKWRQGNSTPKTNELPIVAECLGCSITDLYEFSDELNENIAKKEITKHPLKYNETIKKYNDENSVDLAYYKDDYVCAGSNDALSQCNVSKPVTFYRAFLQEQLGMSNFDNLHIVNTIGNSMDPTIKEGALLIVNPMEKESVIMNGAIYTVLYYGSPYVKRIQHNPKTGEITLISDNEFYDAIKIEEEDRENFQLIGRVLAHFNFI